MIASGSPAPVRVGVGTWSLQPCQLKQVWVGSLTHEAASQFSREHLGIRNACRCLMAPLNPVCILTGCPPQPELPDGVVFLKRTGPGFTLDRDLDEPGQSNTVLGNICWAPGTHAQPRFRGLRHLQDTSSCPALCSASSLWPCLVERALD